ncbi:MAG: hypothetical protein IJ667_01945 [Synergistaceae bacterium]|nr:hypothetical protein [Synergistaceae bacterium]
MFDDALFQLLDSDEFQNVFCRNCPKYRERLKWINTRRQEEIAALEFFAGMTSGVSDETPLEVIDKPSDEITIHIPPDPPCYVTDEPSICLRWKAVTELCEKAHDFEKQCWCVAEGA